MTSPLWTVPLATFVENNCIVFEGAEENMIGHTIIHEKYKELVEGLLENFLADIGIPPDQFAAVLEDAADASEGHELESALRVIAAADDFLLFKALMVQKNLDLEMQVRALYEAQLTGASEIAPEMEMILDDEDDAILQEAMRASLADFSGGGGGGGGDWDDAELAAALEASRLEQEAVVQKAKVKSEQLSKAMQTSLKDLPSLGGSGGGKSKGKGKGKGKTPAKEAASAPVPTKPPSLPGMGNSAGFSASNAAAAWVSSAASAAAGREGRPRSAIKSSGDADGRKQYLMEQRAKLMEKRAAERAKELQAYTGGATSTPAPAAPAPGSVISSDGAGTGMRKALAARLKREVVDKKK